MYIYSQLLSVTIQNCIEYMQKHGKFSLHLEHCYQNNKFSTIAFHCTFDPLGLSTVTVTAGIVTTILPYVVCQSKIHRNKTVFLTVVWLYES